MSSKSIVDSFIIRKEEKKNGTHQTATPHISQRHKRMYLAVDLVHHDYSWALVLRIWANAGQTRKELTASS